MNETAQTGKLYELWAVGIKVVNVIHNRRFLWTPPQK